MLIKFSRWTHVVGVSLFLLLSTHFYVDDPSYETDRGYREPAVLGPAIIDEQEQAAIDNDEEDAPKEIPLAWDRSTIPSQSL